MYGKFIGTLWTEVCISGGQGISLAAAGEVVGHGVRVIGAVSYYRHGLARKASSAKTVYRWLGSLLNGS
jgi:hypothetical protein